MNGGSFNHAIWLSSLFTNQTSWLWSQSRTVPLDALPPANQDPKKRKGLPVFGTSRRNQKGGSHESQNLARGTLPEIQGFAASAEAWTDGAAYMIALATSFQNFRGNFLKLDRQVSKVVFATHDRVSSYWDP